MSKFKVGDRVRIVCPEVPRHGCEGTIYQRGNGMWSKEYGYLKGQIGWRVDVDGWGKRDSNGAAFAYLDSQLEPIVNPDETAWTEFKRYLQPDPIILAKEPA